MKSFEYTIRDEIGIHARPAGILAREAQKYESKIVIKRDGKSAEATKLIAIMALAVKCGQTVIVEVSGPDEKSACTEIRKFFEDNL